MNRSRWGTPPNPRRPPFAEGFPTDPDLDAMLAAFDRGDYASVRRIASRVETSAGSAEVKAAARSLVDRTGTDPLAKLLLALTAVLLITLTAWWWRFNGPGPTPARPPIVEHIH